MKFWSKFEKKNQGKNKLISEIHYINKFIMINLNPQLIRK